MVEVPGWLVPAYVRSVQSAGSPQTKEELAQACQSLIERWSSPDRAYHGLQHVIELLTRLETLLPETHEPGLVRLAAWYHGIVFSTAEEDTYTKKGGENITASATMAETHLLDLDVDQTKAHRVAELIRGMKPTDTKTTTETAQFQAFDVDELALRDAHLGTLAVEPQRYKRYLELVRDEYSHIPRAAFLAARRDIVSRLLARRQLFLTPLARQWDARARENLEAELERIGRMIAEYENSPEGAAERGMEHGGSGEAGAAGVAEASGSRAGMAGTAGGTASQPASATEQPADTRNSEAEQVEERSESTGQRGSGSPALSGAPGDGAARESAIFAHDLLAGASESSAPSAASTVASATPAPTNASAESSQGSADTTPIRTALSAHSASAVTAHSPADADDAAAALLAASAEAEEAERREAEKEAAAARQTDITSYACFAEKDTLSSMEACHERVDPGLPEREATTAEERKKRRREEVAAELRRRIEQRHKAACAAKEARNALSNGDIRGKVDGAGAAGREGAAPLAAGFPSKEQVEFFSHFSSDDEARPSWIVADESAWNEATETSRSKDGSVVREPAAHGDEVTPAGIMAPAPPDVSTTADIPVVKAEPADVDEPARSGDVVLPVTGAEQPSSTSAFSADTGDTADLDITVEYPRSGAARKVQRPTRDQDAPPPRLTRDAEEEMEAGAVPDVPVHGMEREPEM